MSSFDDNLAELRNIQADEESQERNQTHSTISPDHERQPLLNHSVQPYPSNEAQAAAIQTTSNTDDHHDPESTGDPPNTMPSSLFFTLSTIYGASSVMLGAFGAHGLKKRISDPARITNWGTAAQYQLVHSVALLATSLVLPHRVQRVPAALWVAGMTMFSGSIYLLVLDPQRFKALGPVTPLGGLCLIGGWIGMGIVGRRFVPLK